MWFIIHQIVAVTGRGTKRLILRLMLVVFAATHAWRLYSTILNVLLLTQHGSWYLVLNIMNGMVPHSTMAKAHSEIGNDVQFRNN